MCFAPEVIRVMGKGSKVLFIGVPDKVTRSLVCIADLKLFCFFGLFEY